MEFKVFSNTTFFFLNESQFKLNHSYSNIIQKFYI